MIGKMIKGIKSFTAWLWCYVVKPHVTRRYELYEYGTCNKLRARRNRMTGAVQFVLWKAGEQGHDSDFWINFDRSWFKRFTKENGA